MRISVGLDVSKGQSTVAYAWDSKKTPPDPFNVEHNYSNLKWFVAQLSKLDGDIRIVCEETGNYSDPIVTFLQDEGFFVSSENPMAIKRFSPNPLHEKKTDLKDAEKIAEYGLTYWKFLKEHTTMEPIREQLKIINHQRDLSVRHKTSNINSLISLTDKVYPGVNKLFSPTPKKDKEKWVDFLSCFWHPECVSRLSFQQFSEKYKDFSHNKEYQFSEPKAKIIYENSSAVIPTLPKNMVTKRIVLKAIKRTRNSIREVAEYDQILIETAKKLPEFETVNAMEGVSELLAAQLIAEIGDVTRFRSRKSLIAFAGLDPGVQQSGTQEKKRNKTTKRGNKFLRRTLFLIIDNINMRKPENDEIYKFLDKKRSEGKEFLVYKTAAANKFLRLYFGKVNAAMRDYRLEERKKWHS